MAEGQLSTSQEAKIANSMATESKIGRSNSMVTSYIQQKAPVDPYNLDFKQLKAEYMQKTTKKVQFAKSSFLHYCKNNYAYSELYGGRDNVITMELVQEPCELSYKDLKTKEKSKQGTNCDKGDLLLFRQTAIERAPYYNAPTSACNICFKEITCYRGFYACAKADTDCDYSVCCDCFRGKKNYKAGITCAAGDPLSLRTWGINGEKCDSCEKDIESSRGFFQCHKNCNYFICPDCFQGKKIVMEGKTCSTGEVLLRSTTPRRRPPFNSTPKTSCNLCQKEIICSQGYFACNKAEEDCDDNYCPDCWQQARGPATCYEGHVLEQIEDKSRQTSCNVCGARINGSAEFYRCVDRCNYDVCPDCIQADKYLIIEELGVHENVVASKTAGAPFGTVKREIVSGRNLEDCITQLNELAEELFTSDSIKAVDIGFTVQAQQYMGPESQAIGYIFYKTGLDADTDRVLKCVWQTHSADKSWEECMSWLRAEIKKQGSRYFKHCYSPLTGTSEEKMTAVWYWENTKQEEVTLNFDFIEEYDWESLQEVIKDFAAKQYKKARILDVKVGIQEGNEGMYATFVTIDDPKATGGFILGFEQFYGTYDGTIAQMTEKFKTCSETFFVGTSLCFGDNQDPNEKTTIMGLYDPSGESIEPELVSGDDRPYSGDMFTCDKKKKPITYTCYLEKAKEKNGRSQTRLIML